MSPCDDGEVRELLAQMRRASAQRGVQPKRCDPLPRAALEQVLTACAGESLRDKRDRALLLFG